MLQFGAGGIFLKAKISSNRSASHVSDSPIGQSVSFTNNLIGYKFRHQNKISLHLSLGRNSFFTMNKTEEVPPIEKLIQQINNRLETAKKNGKLLLIISGEDHYDPSSKDINLKIMSICKMQFSIKTLAIEADNLDGLMNSPHDDLNYKSYLTQALNEQWNIVPVDKYHKDIGPIWHRDSGMIEWLINRISDHTLFIVGANHLFGLNKTELLRKKFEVVFVNSAETHLLRSLKGLEDIETKWTINENVVAQLYTSNRKRL